MWPDHWPAITREIAEGSVVALTAVREESRPRFDEAVEVLVALPYEQVTAVHSGMARELFEELHPDGLAGEDVQAVLESVVRRGVRWVPSLDPDAVVAVLTGTLGVHDPDEKRPRIVPGRYITAGVLVLAELVAARRCDPRPYLTRAVGEIERAETMEMP